MSFHERDAVKRASKLDNKDRLQELMEDPWLSTSQQSSPRVRRAAERGLGRVTRNLASVALDKEASLMSGSITPLSLKKKTYKPIVSPEDDLLAFSKSYLGEESRDRIRDTYTFTSRATQEGVALVLADKALEQAIKQELFSSTLDEKTFKPEQLSPVLEDKNLKHQVSSRSISAVKQLAIQSLLAQKQGIKLALKSEDKAWIRQGREELRETNIFTPKPLPKITGATRPLLDPTSPLGRQLNFTSSNFIELATSAKRIAFSSQVDENAAGSRRGHFTLPGAGGAGNVPVR